LDLLDRARLAALSRNAGQESRSILANHENVEGLFVAPVPVTVTGSLFWDGEHRFPHRRGIAVEST
jgi:hypothetical protein